MNIIKRIFLISNLLVLEKFHSQIKMDLNIDNKNKKAHLKLINESNDDLIIPIDTLSLRPYFDDICLDITEYTFIYPTLGLQIKLEQNNEIIESAATSGKIDDFNQIKKEAKKENKEKKNFERLVQAWQKKNNIKSFEDAKINYYIFNNLIRLKPGETIERTFYFDLHNITNGKYMYYYYHIEDDKQYDISLSLSVKNCLYDYLTTAQKNSFHNYKLFIGEIESNNIRLK